ncbi:HisA/HisF-related TIM barrel protein, partial [Staphylococcus aureus]|uniref:HisA/HisF-related TIM barrel protein n=1 Tax=Staphylococcus aureus TaxID=1280 RepID=UPI0037DA6241
PPPDQLLFLHISNTEHRHTLILQLIQHTPSPFFIPLTLPPPIQTLHHITQFLNHRPHKLSLNSTPLKNPHLIKQASD